MLCGLNVSIFSTPPVDTSTCKDPTLIALTDATIKWQLYIDSLRNAFDVAWYAKCTNAKKLESFLPCRVLHQFYFFPAECCISFIGDVSAKAKCVSSLPSVASVL
jgi:hypothetical protein